jgi:dTDP-glucose pyrophosphorylase
LPVPGNFASWTRLSEPLKALQLIVLQPRHRLYIDQPYFKGLRVTVKAYSHWRDATLPPTATIEQAVQCLNATGVQIVLIIGAKDNLVGTVTDGDIRRALLQGLSLKNPVEPAIHKNPIVGFAGMGRDMLKQLMRANRIHQLPVVNEEGEVVDLQLWNDVAVSTDRRNLMVVMAGGLGTRLHPRTEKCPKPLLPVAGKPMLEHILDRAKAEGFSRFVFAVRHLGHMIEEHFGDGARWNIRIDYLREEEPLGTAGALSLLSPVPDQAILVTNGDVLTDIRYGEFLDFHERNGAQATMAVHRFEWQHPFGVVEVDNLDVIGFEEKPIHRSYVNAGVYALQPEALALIKKGERCDMPDVFRAAKANGKRAIVYPMHEPWLDVGRPTDYDNATSAVNGASSRQETK